MQTKQKLEKMVSDENLKDWKPLEKKENYQTYVMQDSLGNLYSRGDCQIQRNRKQIEEFLKNMNLRNKYDEMFKELKTLKEYPEQELELAYCRFKAQWPVDDRDFVLAQGYVRENETTYVVATSVDYKDPNIPVDKKTVRGVLMAGGWIL